MLSSRMLLTCARCQGQFDHTKVRTLDGKRYTCKACLGEVEREAKAIERKQQEICSFQCVTCRYQFKRTLANQPKVCPQCGAKEFLKFDSRKLTSSNLLRIADDPRLDRFDKGASWDRVK